MGSRGGRLVGIWATDDACWGLLNFTNEDDDVPTFCPVGPLEEETEIYLLGSC